MGAIQFKRATAAEWTAANPVLALGQPGLETNTRKVKYGDGSTAWNALGYSVAAVTVSWGDIAGSISAQADLAAALGGKLAKASNLSDLASIPTARANLRNSCRVTISANLSALDFSAGYVVPWNSEIWDDASWHDNSTNPQRLTVPAGVDRVEFVVGVRLAGLTANLQVLIQIIKNGTTPIAEFNFFTSTVSQFATFPGADSCAAGDYYTVKVSQTGGTTTGQINTAATVQFVAKAV